jgi:hypothetical protein
MPFSSAMKLAHSFKIPTKLIMFDSIPSYCISLNNDSTFYPCPHFTSLSIMEFEAMAFHIGSIILNIFHASIMLPHLLYMSMKLLPT